MPLGFLSPGASARTLLSGFRGNLDGRDSLMLALLMVEACQDNLVSGFEGLQAVQGLAHDGCGHVLTLLILDGERLPLKVHGDHLAVYRVALALGQEGAQRRRHHSRHEKQTHAQGQSLHNSSSTLVQTLNWVGPAYRTPAGSCQVLFPFLVQQFTCPVGPGAPLSNSRKAVPPWSFRPAPTLLHLPSVLESPDGNLAGASSPPPRVWKCSPGAA